MRRVGVGVVGAGRAGLAQVEAIRRLGYADLIAVAVRDRGKAEALLGARGTPRILGDWRELVADPRIEVVHDCTPNHLHAEIARAAIDAGKHILSEKPLSVDSAGTRMLRDAARERGVRAAVNFTYRHHALVQHARGMVEEGALGEIRAVRGEYLQDWLLDPGDYDWRTEARLGGPSRALADIGSHWLDLARFLVGREILELCADLATFVPLRSRPSAEGGPGVPFAVDTEDYASLLLRFEGGVRGSFAVSQVSPGRRLGLRIEIEGSLASLRWEQARADELLVGYGDRPNEVILPRPALLNGRGRAAAASGGEAPERWPDAQKSMINSFYRTILGEAEPAYADFADAHRIQLAIEAALASDRDRSWKKLGE